MNQIAIQCPKCYATGLTRHCCRLCIDEWHERIPNLKPRDLQNDPVRRAEVSRYDAIANHGAAVYSGHADTKPRVRAELVRDLLAQENVTAFTEIGPGFGELMDITPEYERVAVDHSYHFLEILKGRLPDVRCVQGFADCLPLAYTPALVADSVFQTLPYMERFLCEAARVAEVFMFSVAYRWNYPRRPQQGFDVRDEDQRRVLMRYLQELGFYIQTWDWYSLEKEAWVNGYEAGDYLYIVGRKP